jgi:hypothetical protein
MLLSFLYLYFLFFVGVNITFFPIHRPKFVILKKINQEEVSIAQKINYGFIVKLNIVSVLPLKNNYPNRSNNSKKQNHSTGLFRFVSACFGLLRNSSVCFGSFDIGSKHRNKPEIFCFWFHETNRSKCETDLVSVRTEIYFCLFRGHPTWAPLKKCSAEILHTWHQWTQRTKYKR